MEKEEIVAETPFAIAGVTLVPIVKKSLDYWQGKRQMCYFGTGQPVGLVVFSPQGRRAFRINGEEITLDQLSSEFPGIKETLGWL